MANNTENKNNDSKWSYPEKWGFTIIGVLFIGFIIFILSWFLTKGHSPESHHIHIYLTPDTLQYEVKDLYTRAEVDTLISALQNHESLLEQKYQYILDQHEEDDRLRIWATIIVGLIVSIAAFFGFKNIAELKQQCRKDASSIAIETATNTAEAVAETKAETKADETARNVATTVAKAETEKLAKDICKNIASEIAKKTAEEITGEYLRLKLKSSIDSQLCYIQETTVFQNLKKENEEVIRIGLEKIQSVINNTPLTQNTTADERPTQLDPPELNLDIPDENRS